MNNPGLTLLSDDGSVRGFFLNARELVGKAFSYHQTAPVVTAGLGRLLTAAAIMGRTLKNNDDLITLQIEGDGPVKTLLATAGRDSAVKGFAGNRIVDIPLKPNGKLDVSGSIGKGYLTVLRDNGKSTPYASRTELISGEIAEDITHYYATSEQTPSACALGVLVDRDYTVRSAGGFLVQLLPGAGEGPVHKLEVNLQKITRVSELFEEKSLEEIAAAVMDGIPFHVTENWSARYYCNCSKTRSERILLSLGTKELARLAEDGEPVELNCSFCNKKYAFSPVEIQKLLQKTLGK